ncbi:MAG: universal stress protein [Anaerolineaceae bacterium]|nr:universal stress protein [Anaerolineaceae bacterium]
MATILCATRGGEASIHTQQHAIKLAQTQGANLIFLYVADVQFLSHTAAAIVVDVATEIEHMGEFLLLMAKERAEKAGVKSDTLVKRGVFRHALAEAAQEVGATLIVLGSPQEDDPDMQNLLNEVAGVIKEQTGVDVVIVGRE